MCITLNGNSGIQHLQSAPRINRPQQQQQNVQSQNVQQQNVSQNQNQVQVSQPNSSGNSVSSPPSPQAVLNAVNSGTVNSNRANSFGSPNNVQNFSSVNNASSVNHSNQNNNQVNVQNSSPNNNSGVQNASSGNNSNPDLEHDRQRFHNVDAAHIEDHDYQRPDMSASIGPLRTREQRMQALSRITQLDGINSTQSDPDRCGAAGFTAAALYTGGVQGLQVLVRGIERYNNSLPQSQRTDLSSLSEVRQHLNQGQVSHGDIARIQDTLYHTLGGVDPNGHNGDLTGLRINAFEDFMRHGFPNEASLRNVFSPDMNLRRIGVGLDRDNQPQGHFILRFQHDGHEAVFDPWPRNGGQIIQNQSDLQLYRGAEIGRDIRRPDYTHSH